MVSRKVSGILRGIIPLHKERKPSFPQGKSEASRFPGQQSSIRAPSAATLWREMTLPGYLVDDIRP